MRPSKASCLMKTLELMGTQGEVYTMRTDPNNLACKLAQPEFQSVGKSSVGPGEVTSVRTAED